MARLRAAVVGAGNMGRHHIRLLAGLDEIDLVAVVEPDSERAHVNAAASGASIVASLAELPVVDMVVVATPTKDHAMIAAELLRRGVHVLVEKPMTETEGQARELVDLAAKRGVVLAVGHVERFNPAVSLLARVVQEPLLMSFERLSPYTPRIADSVVFDLMIHDLDVACWLAGSEPVRVEAVGAKVVSETMDVCSAVLHFPSGCVATLQASRVTQDKVRRVAISERERFLVADSVRQDVSVKREVTVDYDDQGDTPAYRQANVVEIPYLDRSGEPIARELLDFVSAVRTGGPPLVDGGAGLRAVRLAAAVERAALRARA